ncbi:unnamed protein product [Rotaria magnacalcarata]|uniref:G-protein coupled receptors family 1 profile domain-containing protein n=1 Tax=Rotaria magnacalcarata TaxID=392030 RepID=A0A8S2JWT8_9BILA|nr:unnamed protein product [Rotaria magnacalcarata]
MSTQTETNASMILFESITKNQYRIGGPILIMLALLAAMLDIGYNINTGSYNIFCCPAIDRMFITSPSVETRRRSNNNFAYKSIISDTLFWIIFSSHSFIFADTVQLVPNHFICYTKFGFYPACIAYYSLIKIISMSSLMIVFGSLTVRNIRNVRRVSGARIITS